MTPLPPMNYGDLPFATRPVTPEDHAFIYSSFLRSYQNSPVNKHIPKKEFWSLLHDDIEELLANRVVTVACDPGEPDEIFGYVIGTSSILDYAYVKQIYRGMGVGTGLVASLLPCKTMKYSHFTLSGSEFIRHLKRVLPITDFEFWPLGADEKFTESVAGRLPPA